MHRAMIYPKPLDSPGSLDDELPEPGEMIDATENVGDLGEVGMGIQWREKCDHRQRVDVNN